MSNNKHQADLSSTRTESSGHYHCSIYAIKPLQPKQWTGTYKNVSELVQMTGLPYTEWLKLHPKPTKSQRAAGTPKQARKSNLDILAQLMA